MLSKPQDFVVQNSIPTPFCGCWLWTGPGAGISYGGTSFEGIRGAHRIAFTAFKGSIPPGKYVLHTCDTPACVNPDHLYVGSRADNVHDMVDRQRTRLKGMGYLHKLATIALKRHAERLLNAYIQTLGSNVIQQQLPDPADEKTKRFFAEMMIRRAMVSALKLCQGSGSIPQCAPQAYYIGLMDFLFDVTASHADMPIGVSMLDSSTSSEAVKEAMHDRLQDFHREHDLKIKFSKIVRHLTLTRPV